MDRIAKYIVLSLLMSGCGSVGANECEYMLGDVDGDGRIVAFDAAIALGISRGEITATDCSKRAADYDGNGVITKEDADAIFLVAIDTAD